MNDMLVICREVDKNSGEIAVYPLEVMVTGNMLAILSLRARLNPELRYFVTLATTWDDLNYKKTIEKVLGRKNVTPKMFEEHGGLIVEV